MASKRAARWLGFVVAGVAMLALLPACKNPLLNHMEKIITVAATPPSINAVYPTDGQTGVPINTKNISVTFSKSIDASSIASSTFQVAVSGGGTLTGTYQVSADTATFVPSSDLAYGATYQVTLTAGILDTDGNSLGHAYSWSFTTGDAPDNLAPVGVSVTINGGALWTSSSTVELLLEADDDTGVAQMNISNTGSFSDSNWTTFQNPHTWQLADGEGTRTVSVKFRDAAGNTTSALVTDSIDVDLLQPLVLSFLIDGGRSATRESTVDLTLSASDPPGGSGLTDFRIRFAGQSWQAWQPLVSGAGSVTGLVLTVGLGETETLEAQVQDLAGNLSAVASASIIYERTPPSVLDVNWDNDPTFPYNGSVIQILFDEAMDPASFSSSNYLLQRVSDEATIPGTISLTEGNSIPNSAAQIWGLELSPNTQYKVTLGSGVTDVAGNLFGSDRTWYFSTGDATDATAPTGTLTLSDYDDAGPVRVVTLPAGSTATNNASIQIDLSAVTDDYNSRYGMKFWGDNDGSYPAFEQFASWEPFAVTKTWVLSPGAGVKYVLYKLMDSAGNESEHPGQLKIVLDDGTDVPAVSAVTIDGGATHTNDPEGKVDLDITASDEQSGLKEMWIANDAGFSTGSWEPWSPVKTEWVLPAGDGSKSVYVMVRDYLDQESPPASSPIILDLTAPEVSFAADQVITNAEVQLLEGADGTDKYRIVEPHGVGTILWEQLSGPGAVDFQDAANGDGSDEREPFVSADSEGTYFVRVTVTDQAGNVGSASSPFVWDVTPPASTLSVSANPYSTSGQPTWSWSAVTGTDFYRCSFDDFATWVDTTQTSFVPNDPLADGSHTLKVVARDLAGNQSNLSSKAVFVDTLPPVITNDGQSFIDNLATAGWSIDYNGASGTATDPNAGTTGSGLAGVVWAQVGGPATLSIASPTSKVPGITAPQDGTYEVRLTATDAAGNARLAYFMLIRDKVAPTKPTVTGIAETPNVRPTWYWEGSGGGVGVYKYKLDGGAWSGETTVTSFKPPSALSQPATHTLYVQERDGVGNWSSSGSWPIVVDITLTTAPLIELGDAYPALRTVNTVTWVWSSGAGEHPERLYHWRLDGGSWSTASLTETASYSGLSQGAHTLEVEEYLSGWLGYIGSHTITVDTIAPSAPTVTGTGLATADPGRTATPDTTPTWGWSGGGGGNGRFNYRLVRTKNADGSADGTVLQDWLAGDTTSTAYTYPTALSNGTYALSVKERDDAGNWSTVVTQSTTVDTMAPVLNSVTLNSGAVYATSVNVTASLSADLSAETATVKAFVYDYNPSGWKEAGNYAATKAVTLPSTNGTRYVYFYLKDEAGNNSASKSDTIILDTVAPTVSISLNGGAATTPSLRSTLSLTATDNISGAADIQVQQYYNGTYYSWKSYSTEMTADFDFTVTAGSKTVGIRAKDAAGNVSSPLIYDSITLEVPVPTYAWKGYYTTGSTRVYYNPVTDPPGGSNATTYYIYSTTNPSANPNSGDPVTYRGSTTSTVYAYVSIPAGQLHYLFVRAYDADTGGWGPYSAASVLGFSGNVTVIYDDDESNDVMRANALKALLEDVQNITSDSYVFGTMPSWTVTLLPEDLVSNTYDAGGQNLIYGDPVILTPGTTFSTSSTYDGRVRNIATAGRGVLAMSYAGSYFLERVDVNWSAWGLGGQRPDVIRYSHTMGLTAVQSAKTRPSSLSEDIWFTPLYYITLFKNYRETEVAANLFTANVGRLGVYIKSGANPTGGFIYAGDPNYPSHFPAVRQGRFLTYGFAEMPNVLRTGEVFFINLVSRMAAF